MGFIPLGCDHTVAHGEAADPCGAPLHIARGGGSIVLPTVVDGVIFAPVLDHAVMPRAFFKFILDDQRGKFSVVGDLDEVHLRQIFLVRFCHGVADVVSVILIAAGAVHQVLPLSVPEPEGTLHGVPVSRRGTLGGVLFFVKFGQEYLPRLMCGSVGIKEAVHKDPRSLQRTLGVVLGVPQKQPCLGFDHVEHEILTDDIFARKETIFNNFYSYI